MGHAIPYPLIEELVVPADIGWNGPCCAVGFLHVSGGMERIGAPLAHLDRKIVDRGGWLPRNWSELIGLAAGSPRAGAWFGVPFPALIAVCKSRDCGEMGSPMSGVGYNFSRKIL